MWRRVELDVVLEHPPERVFPWLADPASWPAWAPAVVERRRIGDGAAVVGSRWASIDRIGPFRVRFTDEMVVLEPDRLVVWDSTTPWNSRVAYLLVPHSSGTRILARYEGDVAGWLRVLALLPRVILARILMRDFHGLRRVLAAQTGSVSEDRLEAPTST